MAELKIYLSKGLNDKFRRVAMSVYGYGRGSLSKAAEEAFSKWCADHAKLTESSQPGQEDKAENTAAAESHVDPDEREKLDSEAKIPSGTNRQSQG